MFVDAVALCKVPWLSKSAIWALLLTSFSVAPAKQIPPPGTSLMCTLCPACASAKRRSRISSYRRSNDQQPTSMYSPKNKDWYFKSCEAFVRTCCQDGQKTLSILHFYQSWKRKGILCVALSECRLTVWISTKPTRTLVTMSAAASILLKIVSMTLGMTPRPTPPGANALPMVYVFPADYQPLSKPLKLLHLLTLEGNLRTDI